MPDFTVSQQRCAKGCLRQARRLIHGSLGPASSAVCFGPQRLHPVRLCTAQVLRGKEVVHEGNIVSLRRVKDDVKDVAAGLECGVGVADFAGWKEGDRLEVFQVEQKQRTLEEASAAG